MKSKKRAKSLFDREMEDPAYRKRHEESYELFKIEVQLLNALERKHWSYSDLARVLHTHKNTISRDLKGGNLRAVSIGRITKMAEALGLKFFPLCIPKQKAKRVLPVIDNLVTA